jgi:hypothetical protein
MFFGKSLCIATKHHKEQVLAPLFKKLGFKVCVPHNLDTDVLGTFSGEVERMYTPQETLKKKCELAIQRTAADFILSSEGSFGPHPKIPFLYANEEHVLFYNVFDNTEIYARHVFTETNFNSQEIYSWVALLQFCEQVKFPQHAIILKSQHANPLVLVKGICSFAQLKTAYKAIKNKSNIVIAETDMRAMFNPTRMHNIKLLAEQLIHKIQSLCPQCQLMGFDVVHSISGLPCKNCLNPTATVLKHIKKCKGCNFIQETLPSHNLSHEDPMYCDYCNP